MRLSVSSNYQAGQLPSSKLTEAEVIRRLLVKLITAKSPETSTRVITDLRVEGRAPTTVSSGQGDHTVAETLIVEGLRGICRFKEYWPAYDALLNNALTFAEANRVERYDAEKIIAEFRETGREAFLKLDAEDQLLSIEALIDTLIRAANKVANSAFTKKEGVTSGGGKEKEAIEQIREIAGGGAASWEVLDAVAPYIVELIDYTKFDDVLVGACVRALRLAFKAAPALSTKQHLLVPLLVQALMSARFPTLLGRGDALADAVQKGLGQSSAEVTLKDWGKEEAEKNPAQVMDDIAPEFEASLTQFLPPGRGGPPAQVFHTTPMRTPQVVTTAKLNLSPGRANGSFYESPDGKGSYLILNSSSSSSGQTTYDVAKLVVHQVPDTPGLASSGPVVGAIATWDSKPHQVVHIQGSPGGRVYFLVLAA